MLSTARDAKKPRENPFKPPKDNDIFELRSREKERRKMVLVFDLQITNSI